MSAVYMVVGTEEQEVKYCEAYAGVQSALGRAIQISSDLAGRGRVDLIDTSPEEEKLSDGSVRWVFMDTNKHMVMVLFRHISASLPSARDPLSMVNVPPPPPPPPVYDFENNDLPAGWRLNGQPALMLYMKQAPVDVKDPLYDLNSNEKWALVIARVKKSPGYRQIPKGYSGFVADQAFALKELEGRTQTGEQIRDAEIELLHILRDNYTDK